MAILTIPPIVKGTPSTVTLDKAALAAVITNPYYAVTTNWSQVVFRFNSDTVGSTQHKFLVFDASEATPSCEYLSTTTSDSDVFEVQHLVVFDNDGGSLVIELAELDTLVDLNDFSMDTGVAPLFTWSNLTGDATSSGGGQLQNNGGGNAWLNGGFSNDGLMGDFTFTCELDYDGTSDTMVGYAKTDPSIGNDFFAAAFRMAYFHTTLTGYQQGSNTGTIAGYVGAAVYTCEVERVLGTLTVKINGNLAHTESYAGAVYVGAVIYQGTATTNITEATLVQ